MIRPRRAGFTLAEVAVTIVIVGIGLTLILQGLNASTMTAAHTRDMRLARELGLRTLGEIASGLWWDEIETGTDGAYEDHPEFTWEIALGDEPFIDDEMDDEAMDTWAERQRIRDEREREKAAEDAEDEDENEPQEPYEKVRVRVHFPKIQELPDHLDIERWIPWEQAYGPEEDEKGDAKGAEGSEGSGGSGETGEK